MKKIISIIISFIVAISTLTFLILGVVFKRPPYTTLSWFSFFTNLSNLLLSIASILLIILTIKNIKSKLFEKFYLASTVSTSLTFFTVALFLSVIEALNGGSYFTFFKGETFFTHLINPIIGFVIYCFFLNNYKLSKKQVFIGLIPMAIYSLIYIPCFNN